MKIIAHLMRERPSALRLRAGIEKGSAYTLVISAVAGTTEHGPEEEESKAISGGDGSQGIGARTGGHASGGEGRYREEAQAGEAQGNARQAAGGGGIGVQKPLVIIERLHLRLHSQSSMHCRCLPRENNQSRKRCWRRCRE